MKDFFNVENLLTQVINGDFEINPKDLYITGASYLYQTTKFPSSKIKYFNYYLLLRVNSYFGACSHSSEQADQKNAFELSGKNLVDALTDRRLHIRIAALDSYFGVVREHSKYAKEKVIIPSGNALEKALCRDKLIVSMADVKKGDTVALIGVVNPIVKLINEIGAVCLPCDLDLEETETGEKIEKDMNIVLNKATKVICTGMTLSNGSFDKILSIVNEKRLPLTMYAQTGSAIVAQFVGKGVTNLLAEPFPFTQFSSLESVLYRY